MSSSLPARTGGRPRTTPTNPHTQLDQQPSDLRWVDELARRVFSLPGVVEEPSGISVPGARALVLAPGEPTGPPEAFLAVASSPTFILVRITACTRCFRLGP
jgi:hypothetical protein